VTQTKHAQDSSYLGIANVQVPSISRLAEEEQML